MAKRGQRTRATLRRERDYEFYPKSLRGRKTVWRKSTWYPYSRSEHTEQVHERLKPIRRRRVVRRDTISAWMKSWTG